MMNKSFIQPTIEYIGANFQRKKERKRERKRER